MYAVAPNALACFHAATSSPAAASDSGSPPVWCRSMFGSGSAAAVADAVSRSSAARITAAP